MTKALSSRCFHPRPAPNFRVAPSSRANAHALIPPFTRPQNYRRLAATVTTPNTSAFEAWIRGPFVSLNTQLEDLYFARQDKSAVVGTGVELKQTLVGQGAVHVTALWREGNTDESFSSSYEVLGNLGFFLAAIERHQIEQEAIELGSVLKEAHALAMHIGASLGVAPRFASAHQLTHNKAHQGAFKSFTTCPDELFFLECNTRGVMAYTRAADALLRTWDLGVSHPVSADLLRCAAEDLRAVIANNDELFSQLDIQRFFYSVRPYYRSYRVGRHVYRGANAGDFSEINVIDLLTGLCQGSDPYYSQLLTDKFAFLRPECQTKLQDCMRKTSLMNLFLDAIQGKPQPRFTDNVEAFLTVCELHGQAATQHHNELVKRFIEGPSAHDEKINPQNITSSGPPLEVLLTALKKLRDLRSAAPRSDIASRHDDLHRLKSWASQQQSSIA